VIKAGYNAPMPARFTKGDIFATEGIRAYAHGCNCAGSMGAGIAIESKRRWPRMFDDYGARCADGRFGLGDVCVWSEGEHTIFSLGTQDHWRKKAQIPALTKSLTRMLELAAHAGIQRVGLPRIGAGLGGLDWPRVKKVIVEAGKGTRVTMVVFEQFVRGAPAERDESSSGE
jgi:O-acetyl-ADP-ribose deacetylase (regulator of RNase III)